jgi:hypothetical protein
MNSAVFAMAFGSEVAGVTTMSRSSPCTRLTVSMTSIGAPTVPYCPRAVQTWRSNTRCARGGRDNGRLARRGGRGEREDALDDRRFEVVRPARAALLMHHKVDSRILAPDDLACFTGRVRPWRAGRPLWFAQSDPVLGVGRRAEPPARRG